jgi:hypothetical protein
MTPYSFVQNEYVENSFVVKGGEVVTGEQKC